MTTSSPAEATDGDAYSRRRFLGIAAGVGSGIAGLALVGCGGSNSGGSATPTTGQGQTSGATQSTAASPSASDPGWKQPAVIQSANGRLDVTLTVKAGQVPHGTKTRWAITVNGTSPGPTLRIRPGDQLRIVLDNQLAHSTNLHTHGLHVSPSGNADNPFIEVKAGEKFTYEMDIPKDHPSGLFWYHPHLHHHVAEQLFSGLFGAIVVEDSVDNLPEIAGATERLVMVHDTRDAATESGVASASMMEQHDGREGDLILVNGLSGQQMSVTAGKLERWRFLNASPSRFYRLKLDGHAFNVIARDGGRLAAPERMEEIILVPGERVEVLVQPVTDGAFVLRSLPVSRGPMGASKEFQLATVTVKGQADAPALPSRITNLTDPATLKPANSREVALEMRTGGGPPRFFVSGKAFDANRVDVQVKLGTVEDWTVRNIGPMDHPFHLHIWPFQVLEQSAPGPVPKGWKDVVNVPAGGFVKLRIPFEQIGGKTVFHCHILDHEDLGMMAVIEAT